MINTIHFYQDSPHSCSYIENLKAQNIYPDPDIRMTNALYSQLIQYGFRRSGDMTYRPYCPNCKACIPVRINVDEFTPSRSQRRCLKRNESLSIKIHPASYNERHFLLYKDYLAARHKNGGMDDPTRDSYINFLISTWSITRFIEIFDKNELLAVAVTDFVDGGISALYTFFNPDLSSKSLGTYAILSQINIAQSLGLSWLYLGYWIENCKKMQYKQAYSAIEGYIDQQWQPLENIKNFE